MEATAERLRAGSYELAGSIIVAASSIPGEFLVPGLLARFTARHPQVCPSLVITDSAGVVNELLARKAEIGFLGAPMAHGRLRLIPFAEDEIALMAPADHPFSEKQAIALADLSGQPLIEREGGSGTLESLRRLLAQRGLRLPDHRVAMVVGTSQAQLAAIEAGLGLGFVSRLALANRPNLRVAVVQIEGLSLRRTLYVAHEEAPISPIAQAIIRFVTEKANHEST